MPPRINSTILKQIWIQLRNNREKYRKLDVDSLIPGGLFHPTKIMTEAPQHSSLIKLDMANPKVQAALITARASVQRAQIASHAALRTAIIGATIGALTIAYTLHDKNQTKEIKKLKEEITEKDTQLNMKDTMVKKKDDLIKEKVDLIKEKVDLIKEKDDLIKEKVDLMEEKDTLIAIKSDIIERQKEPLKQLELLRKQIGKCEQSAWCSFFLNQTGLQAQSEPTIQLRKETISYQKKS